jgi:hypothetical protein
LDHLVDAQASTLQAVLGTLALLYQTNRIRDLRGQTSNEQKNDADTTLPDRLFDLKYTSTAIPHLPRLSHLARNGLTFDNHQSP